MTSTDDYMRSLRAGTIAKADLEYASVIAPTVTEFSPEILAESPNHVNIIAMTNSGKSYLIVDWLSKIHSRYDRIYMISNTAKKQKIYNCIPRENILDTYNDLFLIELYEEAYERSEKGKKNPKTLIIFDDIINDANYLKAPSSTLDRYFTNGRHYNFSVWFLTQSFVKLNTTRRLNVMYSVAFDIESFKERDNYVSSYVSAVNNRVGHILFKSIVKEKPYQCVIVDRTHPGAALSDKLFKYVAEAQEPFKIKKIKADKTEREHDPEGSKVVMRATSVVTKPVTVPVYDSD